MENLDSILLALFCFFSGAVLVGTVVYVRGNKARRRGAGKQAELELVEVAHLWRSGKTRRLVVELDEGMHTSASDLNAIQREQLSNAAAVLQTWLAEAGPAAAPLPAALPPMPTPLPPIPATPIAAQAQAVAAMPPEVRPVAPRPLESIGRRLATTPAQAVPQFKSIAAQINDVLQARLPGSPFEAQGITLVEKADQGVVVRFGAEEYPGVEAVPDPAVRSFIKAAVAEWEAKTRGGIR